MSRLEAALRRAQAQESAPAPAPRTMPPVDTPRLPSVQAEPIGDRDAVEERLARAFRSLTEAPVKPSEPAAAAAALGTSGSGAEKLVITARPEQSTVEQYRKLAATLHHAQVERALKVVMVSSAVSGDGKTLTSTNLALTLSESYRRRVLLIDADLRRPSIHEVFQVKNVAGLTDCLKAETEQRLPLVQVSSYLSLLLAGRPDSDPMSGLTSNRMHRLIEEAAATFDWVIIDTPPVVLLPDANLLAAMVDAAILVIGAGKTPYKLITRAIDALGRPKILGVVLNRVNRSCLAGGYGYGYYSYGDR
jgi:capsular exopolysaccharide synthesis family protein